MTHPNLLPLPSHCLWHEYTKRVHLTTGINMAYMEAGNPDGQPLILIHGFSDSSRIWRLAITRLQEQFHIFAVDLRGFGQSDKPAQFIYSMPQHAEDILAFMDALHIPQADFIAHSMGTMIAQTVAFSAPNRVKKLVLASTMARMHETPADILAMEQLYAGLDMQNASELVLQQTFLPFPENCLDKDFPAGYFSTLRLLSGASLAAAWRGMSLTDNRNFLQFIQAPILILWGTNDSIFTQPYQDEIRSFLPQARFITLENVAHEIPNEAPLVMVRFAQEFFLE